MASKTKHHYVPACYLSGFTEGGLRTSSFWCVPKNNTKPYGTNPNDSCVQRNYYKVEELHDDPLYVEDWYSKEIETKIGDILSFIQHNKKLPSHDGMEILLLLVATFYLRNPNYRKIIASPIQHDAKIMMSMIADSPELYRNSAQSALEKGYITNIPDYGTMKKYFKDGNYEIKATKDYLIEKEIKMIEPVLKHLAYRYWQLYLIPENEEYEFITSDSPFMLNLINSNRNGYVGLKTKDTIITVPINKKIVLIGVLDAVEEGAFKANKIFTGMINSNVAMKCNKVFYSSKEDILLSDGESDLWCHNINKGKL